MVAQLDRVEGHLSKDLNDKGLATWAEGMASVKGPKARKLSVSLWKMDESPQDLNLSWSIIYF